METLADTPAMPHPPSLLPSRAISVPCWYTGIASQMIRNNRQALPPLLPAAFCQEPTSMENTGIAPCATQGDTSGGGWRETEMYRKREGSIGTEGKESEKQTQQQNRTEKENNCKTHPSTCSLPSYCLSGLSAHVSADIQHFVSLQTS